MKVNGHVESLVDSHVTLGLQETQFEWILKNKSMPRNGMHDGNINGGVTEKNISTIVVISIHSIIFVISEFSNLSGFVSGQGEERGWFCVSRGEACTIPAAHADGAHMPVLSGYSHRWGCTCACTPNISMAQFWRDQGLVVGCGPGVGDPCSILPQICSQII